MEPIIHWWNYYPFLSFTLLLLSSLFSSILLPPFAYTQGTLRGFDQTVNVILAGSHERVYSTSSGVEQVQLGLYIIRGDNMWAELLLAFLFVGAQLEGYCVWGELCWASLRQRRVTFSSKIPHSYLAGYEYLSNNIVGYRSHRQVWVGSHSLRCFVYCSLINRVGISEETSSV